MDKLRKFLSCKKGVISLYGVMVALIACIMLAGYLDLTQTTHVVEEIQSIMDITALSSLQGSLDAEGVRFDRLTVRNYEYFRSKNNALGASPAEDELINSETDKDYLLEKLRADGSLAKTTIWIDGTNSDNVDQDEVRSIILNNFNYYIGNLLFTTDGSNKTPLLQFDSLNTKTEYETNSIINSYEIKEFDAGLIYSNWGVDAEVSGGDYQKIPQVYLDATIVLYLEVEPTFSSLNMSIEESHVYNALTSSNSSSKLHVEGYTDDGLLVVSIRTLARMTVQGFLESEDTPDIADLEISYDSLEDTPEEYFDITDEGVVTGFSAAYYALEENLRPKSIKVPQTIRGITPIAIGEGAFAHPEDKIVVMLLPATIHTISKDAFKGASSLKNFGFASGSALTTIGESAFEGCVALIRFSCPSGVGTIPKNAFKGCSNLQNFVFPSSLTSIGEYAFNNCSKLKGSLNLPNTVMSISTGAFLGCNSVTSIHVPKRLTTLGSAAFGKMGSLVSIDNSAGNTKFIVIDNVLYEKESNGEYSLVLYPAKKQNTVYTIPTIDSALVTAIDDYAFYGNQYLQELLYLGNDTEADKKVLSGIQVVGNNAFEKCIALKQLQFADNKTDASGNIVQYGLKSIGTDAFSNTSKLTLVYIDKIRNSVSGSPWGANITITKIKWREDDDFDWSKIYTYTADGTITGLTDYGAAQVNEGLSLIIPLTIHDVSWGDIEVKRIGDNAFSCDAKESIHADANTKILELIIAAPITSIGDNAFKGTRMSAFTLPESITSVGDYAFAESAVANFTISKSKDLTLGDGVFANSVLESIELPANVKNIGTHLFDSCTNLTSVKIEASLTEISDYTFYGCEKVKELVLPSSVTEIGDHAFDGCATLSGINVDKIKNVGTFAFANCSTLGQLTFGADIETIGAGTFNNTKGLVEVYLDVDEDDVEGAPWNAAAHTSILWRNSKWVKYYTYAASGNKWVITGLSDLGREVLTTGELTVFETPAYREKKEVISLSFSSADRTALAKLTGMTVVCTRSVAYEIKADAFLNCTALKDMFLPSSIKTIGANAFKGCSVLDYIVIPDSCMSLGNSAFEGCTKLRSVVLGVGVTVLSDSLFKDCSTLSTLVIEGSIKTIGSNAFNGCASLPDFTLENTVTSLGDYAFKNCTSMTTFVNNNTVLTSFGDGLFYGCSKLDGITIPGKVTTITNSCFYGCTSLTSIVIPDRITTIGASAFRNCSKLATVSIEETSTGLTTIGANAFNGCSVLKELRLGRKISTVATTSLATTSLDDVYIGRPEYTDVQTNANRQKTVPNEDWGATNAFIHWVNDFVITGDAADKAITITLNPRTKTATGEITYTYNGYVGDLKLSSSNTDVATVAMVDEEIIVSAKLAGTTKITISDDYGNSDAVTVTVKNSIEAIADISLNPKFDGSGYSKYVKVYYSGDESDISVSVGNSAIVTTAKWYAGDSQIYVYVGGTSGSTTVTVTGDGCSKSFKVTATHSIAFVSDTQYSWTGGSASVQLQYTGDSSYLSGSSSNSYAVSYAGVSSTNVSVYGNTVGSATITVTDGTVSDSRSFRVYEKLTINVGEIYVVMNSGLGNLYSWYGSTSVGGCYTYEGPKSPSVVVSGSSGGLKASASGNTITISYEGGIPAGTVTVHVNSNCTGTYGTIFIQVSANSSS